MTQRFNHIRTLVELRENIRQFPTLADTHIQNTIVESLPPGYRKIYDWIVSCEQPVTSPMVMQAFEIKHNHASSVLNELWQFGLLERVEQVDSHGRVFVYKLR